jgi:hypothetical protein
MKNGKKETSEHDPSSSGICCEHRVEKKKDRTVNWVVCFYFDMRGFETTHDWRTGKVVTWTRDEGMKYHDRDDTDDGRLD